MKRVRITVLRKQLYRDIAETYLTDYPDVECDFFREEDSFLYEGGAVMPEGFCPLGLGGRLPQRGRAVQRGHLRPLAETGRGKHRLLQGRSAARHLSAGIGGVGGVNRT